MALKLHLIFTTAFERLQEQGKMIALFRRVSKSTIEKKNKFSFNNDLPWMFSEQKYMPKNWKARNSKEVF